MIQPAGPAVRLFRAGALIGLAALILVPLLQSVLLGLTGGRPVRLLAFRVMPPVVLSLPVFIRFARVNLLNSPVGIARVHCLFNLPIAIWILKSFSSAIPRALDETAFPDGQSRRSFFFRHLIPALFSIQTDIGLVTANTVFSRLPALVLIWFARHHIAAGFTIRT